MGILKRLAGAGERSMLNPGSTDDPASILGLCFEKVKLSDRIEKGINGLSGGRLR
jgi:hypothetical protein